MMDSKEQNKHMDEAEHPRDSTNIQGNLFSFFFFFSKIQYHLWKNEVSPYKQAKAAVMNNIHEIERLRKQQQQKTTETQVTQPNKHSSLCTFPGFIQKTFMFPDRTGCTKGFLPILKRKDFANPVTQSVPLKKSAKGMPLVYRQNQSSFECYRPYVPAPK